MPGLSSRRRVQAIRSLKSATPARALGLRIRLRKRLSGPQSCRHVGRQASAALDRQKFGDRSGQPVGVGVIVRVGLALPGADFAKVAAAGEHDQRQFWQARSPAPPVQAPASVRSIAPAWRRSPRPTPGWRPRSPAAGRNRSGRRRNLRRADPRPISSGSCITCRSAGSISLAPPSCAIASDACAHCIR